MPTSLQQHHQQHNAHAVARESRPFPYMGSVAQHPYTEENPKAHGGTMVVQRCICGAERRLNENQGATEYGPWTLSNSYRAGRHQALTWDQASSLHHDEPSTPIIQDSDDQDVTHKFRRLRSKARLHRAGLEALPTKHWRRMRRVSTGERSDPLPTYLNTVTGELVVIDPDGYIRSFAD